MTNAQLAATLEGNRKAERRRMIETGHYAKLMHGQRFADRGRAAKRPGKGSRSASNRAAVREF